MNGFDGKQLNEICKCIEDLGGCVLPISSISIVDYLIVPLTYECLQGTYAKTVVSTFTSHLIPTYHTLSLILPPYIIFLTPVYPHIS